MTLILTFFVLAIAFTGQATMGFGGGLIAIPLLSLLYPVKEAVTLYLFFQMIELFLIISIHNDIDWESAKKIIPSMIIFTFIGSFSLSYLDDLTLRILLSILILTYLLKETVCKDLSLSNQDSSKFAMIAGGAGGWLQGLLGAGGPAFLIYLNEIGLGKSKFRATILLLSFISNLLRSLTSLYTGLLSEKIFFLFLYSAPVVGLALCLGYFLHHKISQNTYKKLTYAVLLISALSLSIGIFEL